MQKPTPPPEPEERRAALAILQYIVDRDNGALRLTPHGLIEAQVVGDNCGQYPHHLADEALGSLVALGVIEQTDIPHVYAVSPRASFAAARRFLRRRRPRAARF